MVSPSAFGEVLHVYAQEYEECDMEELSLHYVPNCPSITPGSIYMFYASDPTSVFDLPGVDQKREASTFEHFTEFQVWQQGFMHVKPAELLNSYYTAVGNNDDSLTTQGMLMLCAGTDIPEGTYGSLYLEAKASFSRIALDKALISSPDAGINVVYTSAVLAADFPFTLIQGATSNRWDYLYGTASRESVFYGTVRDTLPTILYYTPEDATPRSVQAGSLIFARMVPRISSPTLAVLFISYEAASAPTVDELSNGIAVDGQMLYAADYPSFSGTFAMDGKVIQLSD